MVLQFADRNYCREKCNLPINISIISFSHDNRKRICLLKELCYFIRLTLDDIVDNGKTTLAESKWITIV